MASSLFLLLDDIATVLDDVATMTKVAAVLISTTSCRAKRGNRSVKQNRPAGAKTRAIMMVCHYWKQKTI